MAGPNKKLVAAVEAYLADLRRVRASGGATGERSYYPALEGLLRAVGATLKPKVFCVQELAVLGGKTFDVHLNEEAFWRNVPAAVWEYRLGGYQVLKKWLSYREHGVLGRRLRTQEVQHFTDTARRIGALLVASSKGP
ncbi:MAG: hypothetical protein OXG96_02265 [Acidobacteria bacterium]|nr:hypothetical protein [Acidobacteriota bacterium]